MAIGTVSFGDPKLLSASGVIAGGTAMATTPQGAETTVLPGTILGFYVNNTTGGTLVISTNNAGAAGTALTGTITPAIGWHAMPITHPNGLFATIANTLSVTFVVVD